jgi:H/ACA ribonucleoprotein complex subunit 4
MRVLQECETDASFGKPPSQRTLAELLESGIVIVDKPCGPSSHEVTAFVGKILGTKKSGHAGTLDPNVSGVLPVALGRATRVLQYIGVERKKYVCIIRFAKDIPFEKASTVLQSFVGTIVQTPPKMSAVKKVARQRSIYALGALEMKGRDLLFEVECESGTYIRTLCVDAGKKVGGARMLELRRISVGGIAEGSAHTLQEISDAAYFAKETEDETEVRAMVQPIENLLAIPKISIKDSAVEAICAGAPLNAPGVCAIDGKFEQGASVAIMTLKGELGAIAKAAAASARIAGMQGGKVASVERVFMQRGTYPIGWKQRG